MRALIITIAILYMGLRPLHSQSFCLTIQNSQVVENGTKLEFELYMSRDAAVPFRLGTSNLVLEFNNLGLSSPALVSHTLNANYDVPTFTNPLPNRASFNIVLNNDNLGNVIEDTPTLLGKVSFNIVNPSLMSGANWLYTGSTTRTVVFDDVFPAHQLFATSPACLVGQNVVLPVDLISFEARPLEKSIQLKWVVDKEQNLSHYEIFRSLDAKIDFVSIGKVNANSRDQEPQYTYNDAAVNPDQLYLYKLKMVDMDGRFSFSNIVKAAIKGSDSFIDLYPNPVAKGTILQIKTNIDSKSTMLIYDSKNSLVLNKVFTNQFALETSQFSQGTYFYKIEGENFTKTGQIVIF